MESEILNEVIFYLIPERNEIEVGMKQLTKRYSESMEKIIYEVFGYYRIIGETVPKEFFKSYVHKKAAEKCFEKLSCSDMKY